MSYNTKHPSFSSKLASVVGILSLLMILVAPAVTDAAGITAAKDTATRLKISTTADHVFTFTLPTGVDFDSTGNTDVIRVDFPSGFSQGGTWQTSDFTFSDSNGAHTVQNVSAGAGTIDCTVSTAQNVCVAIDTTNLIFTIKPASTYTASSTGSAITFTVFGTTTTGTGTLTNPSSAGSNAVDIGMCDETANCTSAYTNSHSTQIALGIADDDQVSISATVNSTITFDIDTATSDTNSNAPYTVALGTLSTAAASNSDESTINSIWLDVGTNASGGVNVTVTSGNGALKSTSTPADSIPSATATMAPGTANYGICVKSATASSGTLTKASPFNGATCTTGHVNTVGALTTSPQNIITSTAPVGTGRVEIMVNAENNSATPAHTDYADTETYIATATF